MLVPAPAGIGPKHLPALERRKSYAFVAIGRATRYVIWKSTLAATATPSTAGFFSSLPDQLILLSEPNSCI